MPDLDGYHSSDASNRVQGLGCEMTPGQRGHLLLRCPTCGRVAYLAPFASCDACCAPAYARAPRGPSRQRRLRDEQRAQIRARLALGHTYAEIARAVGCSEPTVAKIGRREGRG